MVVAVATPWAAAAKPLARDQVPAPLAPWVDWVLSDVEDAVCPFVHGVAERRQCVWPARLRLTLASEGGRFEQQWRVYRDSWVTLPGDLKSWPEDVSIDGTRAAVVSRGGAPTLRLTPGRHTITGNFSWSELPESLRVPAETGLLALSLDGQRVGFPDRDLAGRLWLRRPPEAEETGSRLDVIVHRRVIDEVPLLLDTRIELKVAGPAREVLLGRAVPEGFVPMSLSTPLPTRVEGDGRLRVQVRPGTWRLNLQSRHRGGPVEAIALEAADLASAEIETAPWDAEEVWVFDARSQLRVVEIEGVPGIDPQQTTLPADWRHLPAYLMTPGSRMQLTERRRGDADPAPDQLALTRTLWLDFDGGGYTVHDQIQGTLNRSWRLEVGAPMALGRVAIDGQDQFLSRLEASDQVGVEVRQGRVDIQADSRMEAVRSQLPAVGWTHDFQSASGQLNLPPGWRLLHASGVDDVRTTWIESWSLLEIFLVLVTTMIVAQLYGIAWGGLAFAALTLTYPEPGAPRFVWLALLGVSALIRVLPAGRVQRAMQLARVGAIVALALVAIPFAVEQARIALYPALELPYLAVQGEVAKTAGVVGGRIEVDRLETAAEDIVVSSLPASQPMLREAKRGRVGGLSNYYAPDPTALVSTGPGLPHWAWRTINFGWRGPVQQSQEIHWVLAPPWLNFVLAWLRVALVSLLVLRLIDVKGVGGMLGGGRAAATGLALFLAIGAPTARAADIPTKELLDELRTRLLEPPECFPACAASPRMQIEVESNVLRMRIEVDTAAETAVPLPGGLKQWVPDRVLLAGKPASGLAHSPDGRLWMPLPPGRHQITLEGGLPERDAVQIPVPLRPHRVVVGRVIGWRLDGVRDGEMETGLQLTRERDVSDGALSTLEAQDLPPFVRVERTLKLGLSWQVETRVVRVSPTGRALFLELPLLEGESPTTASIEVDDGKALVNMSPGASLVAWSSVLDHSAMLTLRAPDQLSWTEVWTVDVSPLWHVDVEGIPTVHAGQTPAIRTRRWQPWPGETVELRIARPASVDGRTLTIDRAAVSVRPGLRSSEQDLTLSLRASRGLQHVVSLPEGSQLMSVHMDDVLQPVRAPEGRVVLPVRPGAHRAKLVWRSETPVSLLYRSPVIHAGAPSVNAEVEIAVPRDRWVLFAGGPRLGPAVLFWSLLLVALLLALGLGRVPLTPLGWGSWFLLFVGMTQIPIWASGIVVAWLMLLGWRRANAELASSAGAFDALQLLIVGLTLLAGVTLIFAVQQGLLGYPDMQIRGNGSSSDLLRWYDDRSGDVLPTPWLVSVPLLVYRLVMLAWALWLARALVRWLRWGWDCFSEQGLWRPFRGEKSSTPQ
jgi:hypothetical protein